MKKKVLIVEDSLTQLASLKTILSKSGYEVLTAKNGAEGVYLTYQEFPDLIVSDIVMPEINGYQLCRLLKNDELTKNIPIILLTVLSEKIDKFWGIRAGANTFIVKDGKFDLLINEIENIFNNVSSISEEERKKFIDARRFEAQSIQSNVNKLLDQSLIESTIINEFRNLSEYVLNAKIFNKKIFMLISSILDYNVAGLFFNDKDEKKEKILNFHIQNIDINEKTLNEIKKDFFSMIFINDLENDEDENVYAHEIFEKTGEEYSSANQISDFQSKVVIPIIYSDKVLGGLCLYHTAPDKFFSSRIFNITIEELKILMRIRWLYSETRLLAITDGLTNLYNRRYFQQSFEREFARAKRYKADLSVVMLDIDNFKNLNDTYGHQFGDKVLAEIARITKNSFRKTDYVARYGGEEIAIILTETTLEKSVIPIERLRKKIEQEDFICGDKIIKATVSLGVATLTYSVQTDQELLKRADQALYTAKKSGRNRAEFHWED
ncbi:MAG: diguanylate cyclase [bacterium]